MTKTSKPDWTILNDEPTALKLNGSFTRTRFTIYGIFPWFKAARQSRDTSARQSGRPPLQPTAGSECKSQQLLLGFSGLVFHSLGGCLSTWRTCSKWKCWKVLLARVSTLCDCTRPFLVVAFLVCLSSRWRNNESAFSDPNARVPTLWMCPRFTSIRLCSQTCTCRMEGCHIVLEHLTLDHHTQCTGCRIYFFTGEPQRKVEMYDNDTLREGQPTSAAWPYRPDCRGHNPAKKNL